MPSLAIKQAGVKEVNILMQGNAGQWCRMLTSTDFSNWSVHGTYQFNCDGTVLLYEYCNPAEACRYYRVVMP